MQPAYTTEQVAALAANERLDITRHHQTKNRYRLMNFVWAWFYLIAAAVALSLLLSAGNSLSPTLWSVYGQWDPDITIDDDNLLQAKVDAVTQQRQLPSGYVSRSDPVHIEWFLVSALWVSAVSYFFVALSGSPQSWTRAARVTEESISSSLIMAGACVYYGIADITLIICLVAIQAVASLLDGMPRREPIAYLKEWSKLGYSLILRFAIWFSLGLVVLQSPAPRWPAIGVGMVHFTLTIVDVVFKSCFLVGDVRHTTTDTVSGNLSLVTKSYVTLAIISMAQSSEKEQWNMFIFITSAMMCTAVLIAIVSSIIIRHFTL